MILQDVIDGSLAKDTLTEKGIKILPVFRESIVCHHEWARLNGDLVCVIANSGDGRTWIVHNLTAKTLVMMNDIGDGELEWIDA